MSRVLPINSLTMIYKSRSSSSGFHGWPRERGTTGGLFVRPPGIMEGFWHFDAFLERFFKARWRMLSRIRRPFFSCSASKSIVLSSIASVASLARCFLHVSWVSLADTSRLRDVMKLRIKENWNLKLQWQTFRKTEVRASYCATKEFYWAHHPSEVGKVITGLVG